MESIKTADGKMVTEELLDKWCDALDHDEWPKGWNNVGKVVSGRPPLSAEGSTVLSVKVPPAMKRAIESNAKNRGVSTSDYVRTLIANSLVQTS
ncbi:MAG: hypothetical protein RR572_04040 [Raoultibacter sp.]